MTERAKPFPFQREGVLKIEALSGRALLADEQGLGKTLQALWYYRRNPHTWPAVVVCPASLKYMWERMAAVHVGVRAAVCEGTRPPAYGFGTRANLYVINYEILKYWLPYFNRICPNLVIIEEGQRICNPNTQQGRAVRTLCTGVPHVVATTATPLMNRPIEIWHVCNILWGKRNKYFKYYQQFGYRFCKPTLSVRGEIEFKGAAHLPELNQMLTTAGMIRRLKADVATQLPPKIRTVVPVELYDPKGEYHAAATDFVGWARRAGLTRAARAGRSAALVRMGYLLRLAARYKLRAALAWVDDQLLNIDKIVLLGHHRKLMEALERRYAGQCVRVDGSVTGRKRDHAVERFQKDKTIRVFIGNDAAREGLTLTAAAVLAFLELYWRPGDHEQAENRIHRFTQHAPTVWLYYLVAHGTIEEWLCELLQEKQGNISAVLDGGAKPDDIDIFEQLMQRMMEEGGGTHGTRKTAALRR